jgi:hypothetical protein
MPFSLTSLFVANLSLGQLGNKQKVRFWPSVRLDFGRRRSVAATHARRRPGSAQYRGGQSARLVNLEQPMSKTLSIARKITKKARRAAEPASAPDAAAAVSEVPAASVISQPRETKALSLRRSLQDPGGVSMASLMASTGWQAHTVRAVLSGLRKKGWAVQRRTEDGVTIYFIDPEAPLPDGETDVARVGDPAQTAGEVAPTPVVSAEDGTAV